MRTIIFSLVALLATTAEAQVQPVCWGRSVQMRPEVIYIQRPLQRDNRFQQRCQPNPVFPPPTPTRPNPTNPTLPPTFPPTYPPTNPPINDKCCQDILAKLRELEGKLGSVNVEFDQRSIDLIAAAVAAKLNLPDTSQLATKTDIQAVIAQIEGLSFPDTANLVTRQDINQLWQQIAARFDQGDGARVNIVTLLTELGSGVTIPPIDPGDPNPNNHLAVLIQRNYQAISSLATRVDLLAKNHEIVVGKVNNIELAVQDHTVQLQSLTNSIRSIDTSVGATGTRIDSIQNDIRNISVRLQRVEGNTTGPLTEEQKEARALELAQALSLAFGGKLRLKFRLDPETGTITGLEPVERVR